MEKSKAAARRSSKHIRKLRALDRDAASEFFEKAPAVELLAIIEESYAHELVKLWLDLKKSAVREAFQRIVSQRKRAARPLLALYHYMEYLTNPLPHAVAAIDGGEMPNYYALVGLPRDASLDDVKEAQKLLLKAHEPESLAPADRKAAAAKREELREAFHILAHEGRRALADARMSNMTYLYPRRDTSWLEAVRRYL